LVAKWVASVAFAVFAGYELLPDVMERRSPASLRQGPATMPAVALTFDDGPHPELTPRVLDALAAAGARATFFVVGQRVRAHPQLLRDIVAGGHAVGVHTDTHRHAWLSTPARTRQEITRALEIVVHTTGGRPLWFRPPYGAFNAVTRRAATACGLHIALWSCDAGDWLPGATEAGIRRRVAGGLRPGAVVDLHDGGQTLPGCRRMVQVLPAILADMRARSLAGVHLGEFFGLPALAPAVRD
jgi:peptidoglycan/xylan/chitin deacetylase (PgdA/CDA1 family)